MHLILVPGLWLDGSSWDQVVPILENAGHRTHALTLPGMEAGDADRSKVTLRDHVDAVVDAIDSVDHGQGKVVLVAHSAGGALAHAAVDARPDRVARVVYVAGEPRGDGDAGAEYPVEKGEVPLPDWSLFDEEMLADLDDELRAELRRRAIPSPASVVLDALQLSDERRYGIPATVIACEFPSAMLRHWMEAGHPGARELAKIGDVDFVDLPAGHWPQFTRPVDLGRAILAAVTPGQDAIPPALSAWHRIVRERDAEGLRNLLADDVVFHSPILHRPQVGRDAALLYLSGALQVLGNDSFTYVREVVGADDAVLEFEATVDGIHVNGVDMIGWNAAGQITDFKVMLRPLKGVNVVHQRMGELLAAFNSSS